MTELSEALAAPTRVTLGGQAVLVYPLDFNDMVEIEDRTGQSMDELDMGAFLRPARNQRWFFWLALRKSQPTLTEQQVGQLFRLGTAPDQAALLAAIFSLSGLDGEGDAKEADPKTTADAPKKRSASAASSRS